MSRTSAGVLRDFHEVEGRVLQFIVFECLENRVNHEVRVLNDLMNDFK